ncbi:MAG: RHS repeat-associated core domain-containing protein [Weeksellaceae bacterium]
MRNSFYISGNYTKHYYAGTQRVSSKIGTTENVGDYLYDWFTQGTGGPVDVIGSSFGVLENAEQGVVQVYDEFGIDPPTYESTPVFIPIQNFTHGGNEVEQYFFHPDHLGSTSYITNLLGEVSQHMEYFAFGAIERKSLAVFLEGCERSSFVEEHRSSNNSPYKFNGKELDEETGWYYYGARYYDPRISVWLSVDPLANVDYLMNDEAYINGQHNGGVYNSLNHNSYSYTYQNPVLYVDPNGKQTFFMHGTFVNNFSMSKTDKLALQNLFGNTNNYSFTIGKKLENNHQDRLDFSIKFANYVISNHKKGEDITLIGHSHGGNVSILSLNILQLYCKAIDEDVNFNLVTINTPVRENTYSIDSYENVSHYNIYNNSDFVQILGGTDSDGKKDIVKRKFKNAFNIKYQDKGGAEGCWISGHCGTSSENVKEWLSELESKVFLNNTSKNPNYEGDAE